MEHKTVSLADQVFDRLESEILTGTYKRGEILTETQLSEDLGVSRTPIREALRRLEQERIVETTGKGICVLGVTDEDLSDIYDVRLRIEPLCAARAALTADDEGIAALRDTVSLQEFFVGKQDPDRIKYQDSCFHETLYRLSGSAVLCDTLTPLHKKVQKYRRASVQDASRAGASFEEHRAICEAIAAHDPKAAEEAMRRHVENAKRHIVKGD